MCSTNYFKVEELFHSQSISFLSMILNLYHGADALVQYDHPCSTCRSWWQHTCLDQSPPTWGCCKQIESILLRLCQRLVQRVCRIQCSPWGTRAPGLECWHVGWDHSPSLLPEMHQESWCCPWYLEDRQWKQMCCVQNSRSRSQLYKHQLLWRSGSGLWRVELSRRSYGQGHDPKGRGAVSTESRAELWPLTWPFHHSLCIPALGGHLVVLEHCVQETCAPFVCVDGKCAYCTRLGNMCSEQSIYGKSATFVERNIHTLLPMEDMWYSITLCPSRFARAYTRATHFPQGVIRNYNGQIAWGMDAILHAW